MSAAIVRLFAVVVLSACAVAQQAFKPLPKFVVHAKYVLVTTQSGYEPTNPGILPEDRQALMTVREAIQKWGLYDLAYQPKDADLVILVRKGRYANVRPTARVNTGSYPDANPKTNPNFDASAHANVNRATNTPMNSATGVSPDVQADIGDPRDMLVLYDKSYGTGSSTPLWRAFVADGLDAPDVPLVQQLRAEVEQTAKLQSK
jgi:hypothetical protein